MSWSYSNFLGWIFMAWTAFTRQADLDVGAIVTFRDPIKSSGPLSHVVGKHVNLHVWQDREFRRIKIVSADADKLVIRDERDKAWQLTPKGKTASLERTPADWIVAVQVLL